MFKTGEKKKTKPRTTTTRYAKTKGERDRIEITKM